jgi:hypothetical protein
MFGHGSYARTLSREDQDSWAMYELFLHESWSSLSESQHLLKRHDEGVRKRKQARDAIA